MNSFHIHTVSAEKHSFYVAYVSDNDAPQKWERADKRCEGKAHDGGEGLLGSMEWMARGRTLLVSVRGKHPGGLWQNREADGSRGETYQCVKWQAEIITSNQSGAGSAGRLRLMAADCWCCCFTTLDKWGKEKEGQGTTKPPRLLHFLTTALWLCCEWAC